MRFNDNSSPARVTDKDGERNLNDSPQAQQRTSEQMLETMNRRFVGKKVLIIGDHPHVDRIGIVDRAEKTRVGWGYVVNFPQGDSCFVFSGKNWKIL